ncbi:hypothetical protein [Shewanella sp.]|uniref:hypothetical protein n=1 Tax=Shewanella sp. TaxID=50422 RepID=UPI003A87FAFB
MVSFKYELNQDSVELQASDWFGIERVFVNGQMVSRKLNFGPNSVHKIQLKDGEDCSFKLFIDPQTDELTCRIYKHNQLITSLKQGKNSLIQGQKMLQQGLLLGSSLALLAVLFPF